MIDLLQKSPLLDDIRHCLHFHAFRLVDVLECIQVPGLLVLDNADLMGHDIELAESEIEVGMGMRTLPKAPLPTHLKRIKWKRFASPSKSMGLKTIDCLSTAGEDRGDDWAYLGSTADSAHSRRKGIENMTDVAESGKE